MVLKKLRFVLQVQKEQVFGFIKKTVNCFDHFFSFKIVWDFPGYFGSIKEWVSLKCKTGTISAIIF